MKIILALFTLILAACDQPQSSIPAGNGSLESYPLDGHLFVIYDGGHKGGGGVIHHPGCPCQLSNP